MNQLAFVVAWAFHWPAHRVAQEGEEKRDLLRRRRATERAGTASPGLWSSSPGRVVKERQRERGVEVRQEEGAQSKHTELSTCGVPCFAGRNGNTRSSVLF
jgi:hypothetical protein